MPFVTSSTSKHDRVKSFGVRLRVKTINVPTWYTHGGIMVNRDALSPDHHEHMYNWIARTFEGMVDPENFGVKKPFFRKRTGDWVSLMDPNW